MDQSPYFMTCFDSSHSLASLSDREFGGRPESASAIEASAVSQTGETQGCMWKLAPSSSPNLSIASSPRRMTGCDGEYPRQWRASSEFSMAGIMAAQSPESSWRASIHRSAARTAGSLNGSSPADSQSLANESNAMKKRDRAVPSWGNARLPFSRPSTYSSSTFMPRSLRKIGFLSRTMINGTVLERAQLAMS